MSRREARVNRAGDGQVLGVPLFLSARELRDLGVDLEDTDRVVYTVEDGDLQFSQPNRKVLVE